MRARGRLCRSGKVETDLRAPVRRAKRQEGNLGQAIHLYTLALERDRAHADTRTCATLYYNRSAARRRQGEFEQAAHALREGVQRRAADRRPTTAADRRPTTCTTDDPPPLTGDGPPSAGGRGPTATSDDDESTTTTDD